MQWSIESFDALSSQKVYDILQLRAAVFVVEQNCPYQDVDGLDQEAFHVLGYDKKALVCYTRILPLGSVYQNFAAIGRVVVTQSHRNSGIGHQLMERSIQYYREKCKNQPLKISAQSHLKGFYSSLGFVYKGEDYLEDDIPHCAMYFEKD